MLDKVNSKNRISSACRANSCHNNTCKYNKGWRLITTPLFPISLSTILLFAIQIVLFPINAFAIQESIYNQTINAQPINKQPMYKAIVVSEHALASEIGLNILKQGGNAIDAAVAIGYALAVVQPCCGNLGGGGFMLIHLSDGKNIFLNFREKAPLAANKAMYSSGQFKKDASTFGFAAVAAPGTVLGLETALKDYGTLSQEAVIQPAINLADEGFILRDSDIQILSEYSKDFSKTKNVAQIFLKETPDGYVPYQIGDRLRQSDLAYTLKLLKKSGSNAFYQGSIAKDIVAASQANGGILSLNDFTEYQKNGVDKLPPLQCNFREFQLITAPPPSCGGVALCEALGIIEEIAHSYTPVALAVVMDQIFSDCNQFGDPKFVNNPVDRILSKSYIKSTSEKIKSILIQNLSDYSSYKNTIHNNSKNSNDEANTFQHEQEKNTTHYAVVDTRGNWVLVTYTLNSLFGAKVIAGNTGFFLNNEMDDFTKEVGTANQFGLVQGSANSIEPGKTPLSSMSPTLVLKDNKPILALGAAGGPKIITANLQTFLKVLSRMDIQSAVNSPRIHCQNQPKVVEYELGAINSAVRKALSILGYELKRKQKLGIEEAIYFNPNTQSLEGATDPRRPGGLVLGY